MSADTDIIKAALLRTTTPWSTDEALAALDRLETAEARVQFLLTTDPSEWEPEVIRWVQR